MANYQLLKANIDEKVYENAQQKITGANLNSVLNAMVTTLGAEYQFAGVATIDTNPGTPDAKVFYIANGKGTYTKFGSLEVTEDEVVVLYYDTEWHKVATGIASQAKLTKLGQEVNEKADKQKIFNNLVIQTLHNYAYDDGSGLGFEYPEYQSSEKVAYIPDGVLGRSFTKALFYDKNDNYLGHSESLVSPYPNTAKVAFFYGSGINVADYITYVSKSNNTAQIEQEINGIKIKSFVFTPDIYDGKIYDDGVGVLIDYPGRIATGKMPYIANGVLEGVTVSDVLFWDKNFIYLGRADGIVSPYSGAAYIAFNVTSVGYDPRYYSPQSLENKINLSKIENEQAVGDIEKKALIITPSIFSNKVYDDSTGVLINYSGRIATDKMPYISGGVVEGLSYTNVLFWGSNMEFLGSTNTSVSPYPNTKYIAFNLTSVSDEPRYYSPNCLESRIEEMDSAVQNLKTDSETNLKNIGLAGGTIAPIENKTATIPLVTSSVAGLMSAQDKAKLDNIVINQGSITIEGSGVTKNASAYGFLPTKTAVENAQALKNCLVGGGRILIDYPGVYDLCDSILIPSNTELIFGAGVYIRKQTNSQNVAATYPFINEGAFTRTYNENIKIKGLHLITNGVETENLSSGDVPRIPGLRGQLAFFYIKNLEIDGLYILDGVTQNYNVHICTFENIYLHDIHIEGLKDALHFGRGNNFTIRHCFLKTLDDGLAFNAYDYITSSPEIGWITNGLVEDIHFLPVPESYGLARNILLMAGAWKDWESGMSFHSQGDCVVSNGRIYRTAGDLVKRDIISTEQPTHTSGQQTYSDGITWLYLQDTNIGYTAGCKRIHFKDLFYDRVCDDCANFWFENSVYVRTYYPGAATPVQEDITFEGIRINGNIVNTMLQCITPVQNIKLINSECNASNIFKIPIREIDTNSGIDYGSPSLLLMGNTYNQGGGQAVAMIDKGRSCKLRIVGSLLIGNSSLRRSGTGGSDIEILSSDVEIH